ncbi:MAG: extracellular solute-binding protein [Clostridiales Family XIII bacterium]|jgi:multiple sugar transport system substrate-binding protein|nr:extracellular solute-binding protein [Clostridiales Family XIII bacterium]
MWKRRRILAITISALAALLLLGAGCGADSAAEPVELTMWHTYVEQMKTDFDELVEEFNEGPGAEAGIRVTVTSVANSSVLNEKLLMAASGDPGAPEPPDIAVIYPKIAVTLQSGGKLADLDDYFTEEELAAYVPAFLEEGRFAGGDGGLYLLPIAKSTEVLYVNRTIFDRFAAETPGATLEMLGTFEGILSLAGQYYAWTDAQTPEASGDGKAFYYPDGLFNWYMVGAEQLGGHLVVDGRIDEGSSAFRKLNDAYLSGAAGGGVAIFNDYGNYLAKTGDAVCVTSTSAGAQFYPDEVTYADNTKEAAVFDVLPYPVFEGGEKVAIQRGGGLCLLRSDEGRERAAAAFMKWLTEPAQNERFAAKAGYMPVTSEARAQEADDALVRKMLETVAGMQEGGYRFYVPPVFDGFDEMQTAFVEEAQQQAGARKAEGAEAAEAAEGA